MGGNKPICSLVILFLLTTVSAIQKLHSIKDLKRIDFGSVPQHCLVLLHWFANNIEIDNNDAIPLTFEPNTGDYGAHHYGNYEGLLDALPREGGVKHKYYTLGNINHNNNQESAILVLPSYVTRRLRNLMEYEERNRDRIIFRVRENTAGWQTIDQVYITQHYGAAQDQGTRYDPAYTYRITTHLLRQIREFSMGEDQRNSLEELRNEFGRNIEDFHLRDLESKWGELASLGLLLFIVIRDRHSSDKSKKSSSTDPVACRSQHLPVRIPENKPNHIVVRHSSDKSNKSSSMDPVAYRSQHLPVRIPENKPNHIVVRYSSDKSKKSSSMDPVAYRSQHLPVRIPENKPDHIVVNIPDWLNHFEETGPRGQMELGVRVAGRGKARMYWRNIPDDLLNLGVMVVLFKTNEDGGSSRIYESIGDRASGHCDTSVPLNPGLQVRLHKAKRCCFFWKSVGEEIHRGDEFHNTTERVPIGGYDDSLELFVEDGKACARLYVRKTFTDWAFVFQDCWVGFYSSATKATLEYETWKWQWAAKFSKNVDQGCRSHNVYEYHSRMAIAPGVHARFIHSDLEYARTPAWRDED